MKKTLASAFAISLFFAGTAFADPIEGMWKRVSTGTLVQFSKCGGSYCGVVRSGSFSGQSIGKMKGSNGSYSGTLTDLEEKKTYKGKASISGNTMKLSGCVLGGLICKGENWKRQ